MPHGNHARHRGWPMRSGSGEPAGVSALARFRRCPRLLLLTSIVAAVLGGCGGSGSGRHKTGSTRESVTAAHASGSRGSLGARRFVGIVALENANELGVIAGPPWRVLRHIPAPAGPHNVSASRDGRWVAATSPPSDRVTIVAMPGARVVAQPRVIGYPHDAEFTRRRARGVGDRGAGPTVGRAVRAGRAAAAL